MAETALDFALRDPESRDYGISASAGVGQYPHVERVEVVASDHLIQISQDFNTVVKYFVNDCDVD